MWQIRRDSTLPKQPSEDNGAAGRTAPEYLSLKIELHRRLIELINLQALESMTRPQIEVEVGEIVHEQLALQKHALNQGERRALVIHHDESIPMGAPCADIVAARIVAAECNGGTAAPCTLLAPRIGETLELPRR